MTNPADCEGCADVRENGGSTCGDCGTFLALKPRAPDAISWWRIVTPLAPVTVGLAGLVVASLCHATAAKVIAAIAAIEGLCMVPVKR